MSAENPAEAMVSGQILSAGEGIQNDVDGVGVIARGQDRLGEIAEQAQPVGVRIDSGWNMDAHPRAILIAEA